MEKYDSKQVKRLKPGVYKPKISFEEKLRLDAKIRFKVGKALEELDERRAESRRKILAYRIATGTF